MSTPLNPRQWAERSTVGKTTDVDLGQVGFTQHSIDEDKVTRIAAAMKAGQTMAPPVGSMRNGRFTTEDGHHRMVAAMRLGKKSMRVKIF